MISIARAAGVRAKRGARWLDESFPGWEGRINHTTLRLEDADSCICGQVFNNKSETLTGYDYAHEHLFAQANSWISTIVKMDATEDDKAENRWIREYRVGRALGFLEGIALDQIDGGSGSDAVYVDSDSLQLAWENLLAKRTN